MKHPLFGTSLLVYAIFWIVMIAGHSTVLAQINEFSFKLALLDTATLYPILAGFGMSYFYVVKYISPTGKLAAKDVAIHFVGIFMVVAAITYAHDEIFSLFIQNEEYSDYLSESLGWRIATGVLTISLLVLIYYLTMHSYLMRQQEDKQDSLQLLLKQTEMEMLKFQINPHFIFNSLNSISALTMSSPDKAQEMIIKLSDFFRNALGTEKDDIHTVREELKHVDLYLDIERIRFGDRLDVSFEIDDPCTENKLPAMILQPLFENAIKHGVYENLESVEIRTTVTCKEGRLMVTIANTYDPMNNPRGGAGIGLKNVRTRLELMYGIPDLVTIERTNSHYKVHLLIPQL